MLTKLGIQGGPSLEFPAFMREVLEEVFLGDPFEIKSKRASFLKKWMKRAVQLRAEEQQLHAGLPPHLQPLLKDKKLLLWKDILLDLQYSLMKYVRVPLDGVGPVFGRFPD